MPVVVASIRWMKSSPPTVAEVAATATSVIGSSAVDYYA